MNDVWKGKLRVKKLKNEKMLSTRTTQGVPQCHERCMEGQAQSQEVKQWENAEHENHLRGTASRRVPHLEREMDQMRRVMD